MASAKPSSVDVKSPSGVRAWLARAFTLSVVSVVGWGTWLFFSQMWTGSEIMADLRKSPADAIVDVELYRERDWYRVRDLLSESAKSEEACARLLQVLKKLQRLPMGLGRIGRNERIENEYQLVVKLKDGRTLDFDLHTRTKSGNTVFVELVDRRGGHTKNLGEFRSHSLKEWLDKSLE